MSIIKLALAQLRCNLLHKKDNVKRIVESIKLASRNKADYILFPELYLSGYEISERLADTAEPLNGDSIKEVCNNAKKYNVGVILGFPESDQSKLYNTAVFIGKSGDIIGNYRKIHLFDFEKKVFSPGDQCPVFDLPEGKIGLMISYDIEFPEVARILSVKGAQLLLVLSANKLQSQSRRDVYLSGRALENHVFVAAANKVGLEENTLFFGESIVFHPLGKEVYRSSHNEELPVISINLNEIDQARGALDYLTNRRPDIYRKEWLST